MPKLYSEDYFDANYGHMASKGKITAPILHTLKIQYAAMYTKMCEAAEKLPHADDPTYDRIWMVWMLNYAEPYYLYVMLFRYLKKKGVIDFTENELSNAWGLLKQKVDLSEHQLESA